VAGAAISHVEGVPPLPCVAADVRTVYLLGDSLMASRTFRSSLGQHQDTRMIRSDKRGDEYAFEKFRLSILGSRQEG
jgi:hypothetical protein